MPMWGRMLGLGRSEHYDRGIRLFDQGLHEQAIDSFRRALKERGDALSQRLARFYLGESHTALALSSLQRGAYDRAETELQEAIAINPNYADLHFQLGVARLAKGDPDGSIVALRRALEINPRYAKALLQMGIALYSRGDHEDGLERTVQALALDAAFDRSLLEQAETSDARGDHDLALRCLKRIADADVDDIAFHAKLAVDLFRRGMLAEAVDEFRQALQINPNYADLRNQLGVTLFAMGRDAEAQEEFARALAINPRYVEAYVNRGLALRRLGREDEARSLFNSALAIDPDNEAARAQMEPA